MQVTHVADTVTHAVIGNNKAQDFGIANDAAMMNILSNSLYSDKILAVVREALCNAWDIHIQTGKEDLPVEVTLTRDKLTIRDFGTGISPEDMHPTYCIYGASTKKNDGTQTGGFGLGCKAPFAYVDHFEVTSIHAGIKTIYAISKSSAEVEGKPSLTPLVSIPSTEPSGLSVSLAVSDWDESRFRKTITMIASFGEMNVTLNGTKIQTVPFSKAKLGFLLTRNVEGIPNAGSNQIFLRYGNVVYPISHATEIGVSYSEVKDTLARLVKGQYHYQNRSWNVILQAEPNTISVTPSRETLSMTPHTIKTVRELLNQFLTHTTTELENACFELHAKTVEAAWTIKDNCPGMLVEDVARTPLMMGMTTPVSLAGDETYVTSVEDMSKVLLRNTYPSFRNFRRRDTELRLQQMEKHGLGGPKNRGKIQTFLVEHRANEKNRSSIYSPWFQQKIVQPLLRKIKEVPELSGDKLLVFGAHRDDAVDKNGRRRFGYDREVRFVQAAKLSPRNLYGYIPFLRNIIVLAFNRDDVENRLGDFPIIKKELGSPKELLVYIVSRTDKKIDTVRKFFADQGMTVVDLTKRGDHENEIVLQPKPKPITVALKPRKKGLPTLASILTPSGSKNDFDHKLLQPRLDSAENAPRIEHPKFITKINPRAESTTIISGLQRTSTLLVMQLWGDIGAIAINENQYRRYRDEFNIPAAETWISAKLFDEVNSNPRIQLALMLHHNWGTKLVGWNQGKRALFETIVMTPDLAIEFGMLNELTKKDRKLVQLISSFMGQWHDWRRESLVKNMVAKINALTPLPEMTKLAQRINDSKLVELLDADIFSEVFSGEDDQTITKRRKLQRSGALDILLYALA